MGHGGHALSWTLPEPSSSLLDTVRWEAPSCLSRGPQWGNQTKLDLNPSTVSQNEPVLLFFFNFLSGVYHMTKKFWNSWVPFSGQDSRANHCSCCTIQCKSRNSNFIEKLKLKGPWDGSAGKNTATKPEDLSLSLRIHMREEDNASLHKLKCSKKF